MEKALRVINKLKKSGIIKSYAIGGRIAGLDSKLLAGLLKRFGLAERFRKLKG